MRIRLLQVSDYHKGYFDLLQKLTDAPVIEFERWKSLVQRVLIPPLYYIYVIESEQGKIVATATLMIEQKLIHESAIAGHIEDVVVDEEYRGQGLASQLIQKLIAVAKDRNTYKIVLHCKPELQSLYEKNGFSVFATGMKISQK
jgi:glucosamine-phosphate N-acetyltransferase